MAQARDGMKFIFVTGGVMSGLGKGITTSSIGVLLKSKGLKVVPIKIDPYLNLHVTPTADNNITRGKIYRTVIEKERNGDYLGKTVQIIPHVTDEIKEWLRRVGKRDGAEVGLVGVGGTVGDIEGAPFLEAARQIAMEEGHENVLFVHTTLVPVVATVGEQKTKPTQQSVRELRSIGIQPSPIFAP